MSFQRGASLRESADRWRRRPSSVRDNGQQRKDFVLIVGHLRTPRRKSGRVACLTTLACAVLKGRTTEYRPLGTSSEARLATPFCDVRNGRRTHMTDELTILSAFADGAELIRAKGIDPSYVALNPPTDTLGKIDCLHLFGAWGLSLVPPIVPGSLRCRRASGRGNPYIEIDARGPCFLVPDATFAASPTLSGAAVPFSVKLLTRLTRFDRCQIWTRQEPKRPTRRSRQPYLERLAPRVAMTLYRPIAPSAQCRLSVQALGLSS